MKILKTESGNTNKYILLLLSLCFLNCGPESAFKNANEKKTEKAFEEFIEDNPESEFVPKAKERIMDIQYWKQIRDSLDPRAYDGYIKIYPDGLFINESKYRMDDMTAYYVARDSDIVTSYEDYLKNFPSGINEDYVKEKIEKLKPIEISFEQVKNNPSTDNLKSFIASNKPSGYTKIAYQVLDNILGASIYKSFLEKNSNLPSTYKDLVSEIEKTGNKNLRQTREEYLILLLNSTEVKNRPSVPDSERLVYGENKSRFSIDNAISIKEKTVSANLIGTGNKRGKLTQKTNNINPGDYVYFTELKDDLFHIILNSMPFTTTVGSIIGRSVPYSLNCADGSILRFYGIIFVEGMKVKNTGSEPLTFLLDSKYGWVHLYGSGTVRKNNGKEIKF